MTELSGCGDVRLALGVYVVGAIDPAERSIVDAHLSHCVACREELAGLAGLPALLGHVPARDVERLAESGNGLRGLEEPPPELLSSLLGRVAARRRARKRRTITAAAAAAVIAVGGGMVRSWPRIEPVLAGALAQAVPYPPELVLAHFPHDAPLLGAIALAVDAASSRTDVTDPIDVDETTQQHERSELSAAHTGATSAPAVSSTGK